MESTEAELIAQILDGDREAFRLLVDRHKDALYRHCFYIIHDEDVAEDMAQDALIRAFDQLEKFDAQKASFKTWLFVIGTRLCLAELRRTRPLPLLEEDYALSTYDSPEQKAQAREIHAAVLQLNPRYRTVVTLHYWHGYSYQQIADAMDAPIGSVRGWLHRAKQQLKEALL